MIILEMQEEGDPNKWDKAAIEAVSSRRWGERSAAATGWAGAALGGNAPGWDPPPCLPGFAPCGAPFATPCVDLIRLHST